MNCDLHQEISFKNAKRNKVKRVVAKKKEFLAHQTQFAREKQNTGCLGSGLYLMP
jgi:hypothetical protein